MGRRGQNRFVVTAAAVLAVAALTTAAAAQEDPDKPPRLDRDDAVVIAVIDDAITPYHWNFSAARMPQHLDDDPHNDLPLGEAPHTWLPGFPDPSEAFTSYREMRLTLDDVNPGRSTSSLNSLDNAAWNGVQRSSGSAVHYNWLPGTKVIGLVDFGGNRARGSNGSHGTGSSSVSVGNLHGTCPECLLVFISYDSCFPKTDECPQGEYALNWAMSQPWIDVVTNSYGFSTGVRDRIYDGGNAEQQRAAHERGQTVFFSAGNGQANTFTAPNTTYFSSQEGPDWIVTVGAVHPQTGASFTGHGKPADVASVGLSYPSTGGTSVSSSGTFGGTSNATPVMAGTYGTALLQARRALPGPSRVQEGGVIGVEDPDPERDEVPFECAETRPECELGDGVLTAKELRTRMFHGAVHTPAGMTVSSSGIGETPPIGEDEFANEGHGTYWGRLNGTAQWQQELARIVEPMRGEAATLTRPAGERDWMVVDSYCRQGIWLRWSGGYYRDGITALPPDDPAWPARAGLRHTCERAIADHLPNLVPLDPYDIRIGGPDAGSSGSKALRFSVSTANRSQNALELAMVPTAAFPDDADAYQCVKWTTHRVCQERRHVGTFVYHEAHDHYHFDDYALYELRKLDAEGEPDMSPAGLAAPGVKASFCLIDYSRDGDPPHPIYSQPHPLYLTCIGSFGAGVQGISPGWKDTYVSTLDGQQIIVDSVPDGEYAVVITADPTSRLWETRDDDNVAYTKIRLEGSTVVVLP